VVEIGPNRENEIAQPNVRRSVGFREKSSRGGYFEATIEKDRLEKHPKPQKSPEGDVNDLTGGGTTQLNWQDK